MKIALVFGVMMFAMGTVSSKDLYNTIEKEWNLFKMTYDKSYSDVNEDDFRKKIYLENKLKIEKHNKLYENGEESYTIGMNRFGDWTHEEFLEKMTGFKPSLRNKDKNYTFIEIEQGSLPDSVDWREKGYVTPVKDQNSCDSSWAFSATGAIEGQHFNKTGKLVSLSEQNLIDCSSKYSNDGCEGGLYTSAFEYVISNGGIDTEKSYPYNRTDGNQCRYNRRNIGARISGFQYVARSDKSLMAAVAYVGPVSVGIATTENFDKYTGGVFKDPNCNNYCIDHQVLVVGYGANENGEKYWIIKNSWGTAWGIDGYMNMTRDIENMCFISNYAAYPIV